MLGLILGLITLYLVLNVLHAICCLPFVIYKWLTEREPVQTINYIKYEPTRDDLLRVKMMGSSDWEMRNAANSDDFYRMKHKFLNNNLYKYERSDDCTVS